MTDVKHASGPVALRAALAIIKTLGNPARWHRVKPVTAGELAAIIQGEINHTVLLKAVVEAMELIESHHGDMLTEHRRSHPHGSGWGRVHDKLCRARDLLKGRAAIGGPSVDELEAADLMTAASDMRSTSPTLNLFNH
jgi:hypothetical protein